MSLPNPRFLHAALVSAGLVLAATAVAQPKPKNPSSKLFISDVAGEAQIHTGETIEDLAKRSVYSAQGTIIETKRPAAEKDRNKAYTTMVYSNGTGAFFDADTRVEIRRFQQEPFTPNRSDLDVEPSISQTQAFVSRGTVGLCTSKLVAGSSMSYATPHGMVNIQGGKVVIEADTNTTTISMLAGDSTVRAGAMDMGGHVLHAGEQAVITAAAPGQANTFEIHPIPPNQATQLDDKVAMACMAKRTVYFEVRTRENSALSNNGRVTAFDGDTGSTVAAGDIVAVPVVPTDLPVKFTISPASLLTPAGRVVNPGQGTPTPGG